MNNLPSHLRAKIRGDAIRILNTRAFVTAFDAFMLGVEYALTTKKEEVKSTLGDWEIDESLALRKPDDID